MHKLRSVIHNLHLVSAGPDATVQDVAVTMSKGRVGAIAILEGDALVGIFSERDLMTRVVVAKRDPAKTRVSEVMTHEVVTASPDDRVDECMEKMRHAGCRHLPVVTDGRVIAMVSMRDLLRDEIAEQDQEIRSLRAQQAPS